jgi:hypothetical protein
VKNGGFEVQRPSINLGSTHTIGFYPGTPGSRSSIGKNKPNIDVFGNHSKYAQNWIAGPTHELCLQHIPGYKGHIIGMISENLFAKSYAKCTQVSIGGRNAKGHDLPAKVRFRTISSDEYTEKNFRRFGKKYID